MKGNLIVATVLAIAAPAMAELRDRASDGNAQVAAPFELAPRPVVGPDLGARPGPLTPAMLEPRQIGTGGMVAVLDVSEVELKGTPPRGLTVAFVVDEVMQKHLATARGPRGLMKAMGENIPVPEVLTPYRQAAPQANPETKMEQGGEGK